MAAGSGQCYLQLSNYSLAVITRRLNASSASIRTSRAKTPHKSFHANPPLRQEIFERCLA
eukprot:6136275-Amphidinium_carterae.1